MLPLERDLGRRHRTTPEFWLGRCDVASDPSTCERIGTARFDTASSRRRLDRPVTRAVVSGRVHCPVGAIRSERSAPRLELGDVAVVHTSSPGRARASASSTAAVRRTTLRSPAIRTDGPPTVSTRTGREATGTPGRPSTAVAGKRVDADGPSRPGVERHAPRESAFRVSLGEGHERRGSRPRRSWSVRRPRRSVRPPATLSSEARTRPNFLSSDTNVELSSISIGVRSDTAVVTGDPPSRGSAPSRPDRTSSTSVPALASVLSRTYESHNAISNPCRVVRSARRARQSNR